MRTVRMATYWRFLESLPMDSSIFENGFLLSQGLHGFLTTSISIEGAPETRSGYTLRSQDSAEVLALLTPSLPHPSVAEYFGPLSVKKNPLPN